MHSTNLDKKIITAIGFILSMIALVIGVYCQIEIIPNYSALNSQFELSETDKFLWSYYSDQKFLLGSITLFVGALSTIIGFLLGSIKQKKGWLVLSIGIIAFVLGILHSTHLFG